MALRKKSDETMLTYTQQDLALVGQPCGYEKSYSNITTTIISMTQCISLERKLQIIEEKIRAPLPCSSQLHCQLSNMYMQSWYLYKSKSNTVFGFLHKMHSAFAPSRTDTAWL